jgi:hypothetical protein
MTLESFEARHFHAKTAAMIDHANSIIAEYQVRGFTLTLRQLFYQFVARSLIDDRQSEYKRLGDVINNGRRCGLIDWDAIEDRGRTFLDLDGGKIQRKFRPRRRRCDQARTQRRRDLGLPHRRGRRDLPCRAPARSVAGLGARECRRRRPTFPVLSGIECLTLLAEHETASARAVEACGARWPGAGREVLIVEPFSARAWTTPCEA